MRISGARVRVSGGVAWWWGLSEVLAGVVMEVSGLIGSVSQFSPLSTDKSRCYRCTSDVQWMSQDGIVVHQMFNGCSTDESRWHRCTSDVQRMSRDYNLFDIFHYNDDSHIKGSSTLPRYSSGASTPQSYSSRTSRNAECSNYKHFLGKITVLEATVDMYMHPEKHTVNSAALFQELYNNIRKLDLEYFVIWNVIRMLPCLNVYGFYNVIRMNTYV
uniref:Uncharacterized protein n=1 Tax=Tanacetum cinerariifolium TaxID=118510 RepID=A0A699HDE2_TANCI|nr:hypothetical protein [Tanacetum cinerariifolium]